LTTSRNIIFVLLLSFCLFVSLSAGISLVDVYIYPADFRFPNQGAGYFHNSFEHYIAGALWRLATHSTAAAAAILVRRKIVLLGVIAAVLTAVWVASEPIARMLFPFAQA
jgi:hypothetical protein